MLITIKNINDNKNKHTTFDVILKAIGLEESYKAELSSKDYP